jgi:hypothetical protein
MWQSAAPRLATATGDQHGSFTVVLSAAAADVRSGAALGGAPLDGATGGGAPLDRAAPDSAAR